MDSALWRMISVLIRCGEGRPQTTARKNSKQNKKVERRLLILFQFEKRCEMLSIQEIFIWKVYLGVHKRFSNATFMNKDYGGQNESQIVIDTKQSDSSKFDGNFSGQYNYVLWTKFFLEKKQTDSDFYQPQVKDQEKSCTCAYVSSQDPKYA